MIPVTTYISTRAPNYSTDPRVPDMILQSEVETGTAFGELRNAAIALLVLHWLAMDDRAGGGGGATSNSVGGTIRREREGSLEREYMVDFSLTKMFPDLSQTRWGMELIELRKKCILTPYNRFVINA